LYTVVIEAGAAVIRAGTGTRPYVVGQYNNAVDMVGHNDKRINVNAGVEKGQFIPNGLNHLSSIV
jgi:hypothetical protein